MHSLFYFVMEYFGLGSWNFELVQILSTVLFIRDGKVLLEAVGIFFLFKYSVSMG